MENEIDIVRDVSRRLDQGGLAFMLTGSMAMNYYATPRMTRDIDIVVALRPADSELIERLFAPDYYVAREAVDQSIAQESLFNLIHQASVIKSLAMACRMLCSKFLRKASGESCWRRHINRSRSSSR